MSTSRFRVARIALAVAVAAAAAAPLASQAQSIAAAPRVVVSYQPGSGPAVLAAIARLGGRVTDDLSEVNAVAVSIPAGRVAALKLVRGVDFVEAEVIRRLQGGRVLPGKQRIQAVAGQTVPYGITQVQADQLPPLPSGSTGKKVCIIDSGIDGTHEDLAGLSLAGKNYTASGTWDSDENSHGTHVAGTIAAVNNSLGVVGVAGDKQLPLYIAKVFDAAGTASSISVAKGMIGCLVSRSNVVSMSLGSNSPSNIEKKVLDALEARGALLVAAAGNDGTTGLHYPASFPNVVSVAANDDTESWATFSQFNAEVDISGPGVAVLSTVPPNVLTMGVLTVNGGAYSVQAMAGSPVLSATGPLGDFGFGDVPSAGSMTGKVCLISRGNISFADKVLNCQSSGGVGAVIYNNVTGDLLGTMGDVATTIPSVGATQADGLTMLGQVGLSATVGLVPDPAKYQYFSGTSMSTPHVSAVAALVWSHFPSCTAAQIRTRMEATAKDIGDVGRDDKTGKGLVQAKVMYDAIKNGGC